MKFTTRVALLSILITLIVIAQYLLGEGNSSIYNLYIFQPFQAFRNWLFKTLPFSVGDILYLALLLLLLYWLWRMVEIFFHWSTQKQKFHHRILQLLKASALVYLFFFIGWGGNYFKPSLVKYWQLDSEVPNAKQTLLSYDSFLVQKLNALAPAYYDEVFEKINHQSRLYYQSFTKDHSHFSGLQAKPSLFGYYMQHMAIQGYYNPFTGEAQVNRYLPSFMLPFVICHEMAHQSGIASEEDANLLSYALCSSVPDHLYNYSAYFNLWLYTNSRLRQIDSNLAKELEQSLNPISLQHIDTLRAIRKQFKSPFQQWSAFMYDKFLKINKQRAGLKAYSQVVYSAWVLEQKRKLYDTLLLHLP